MQIPQPPAICPRDLGGGGNERDHSFKFTPDSETGATGGIITEGYCFINGVIKTISSTPASWELSGVTTSTKYWVAVTYDGATAAWVSNANWPTSTTAVECFRILEITCTAGVITSFIQRQTSDIHAGNGDPVIDVQYDTTLHRVQKKTLSSQTWTMVTGGQWEIES